MCGKAEQEMLHGFRGHPNACARCMRILVSCAVTLLLLGTLALAAADVSGKWRGSAAVKLPDGDHVVPMSAEFKQQGKSVTGTTGKDGEEQYAIEKGKIEDGKLICEFTAPEEDESSGKRTYTLRLNIISDTQLEGEFEAMANGEKMTGKVTLARAK